MQEKKVKILYFIEGDVPTPDELEEAKALGTSMFRNASLFDPTGCLEECDGVAGAVPDKYLDAEVPVARPKAKVKAKAKEDEVPPGKTKADEVPPPPPPPAGATGQAPPWKPAQ